MSANLKQAVQEAIDRFSHLAAEHLLDMVCNAQAVARGIETRLAGRENTRIMLNAEDEILAGYVATDLVRRGLAVTLIPDRGGICIQVTKVS